MPKNNSSRIIFLALTAIFLGAVTAIFVQSTSAPPLPQPAYYLYHKGSTPLPSPITLPHPLTPPVSFSLWFKPELGGQDSQAPFVTNPGTAGEIRISTWDNWQTLEANVPACGNSVHQPLPTDFVNRWHHLVRVYSNGEVATYIDNKLNNITAYSSCTPTAKVLNVGVPFFTGSDPYVGQIGDLAFYSDSLTPTQINYLYQQRQGLSGLWHTLVEIFN